MIRFDPSKKISNEPLAKTATGKALSRIEYRHDANPGSVPNDFVTEFPEVNMKMEDEEYLVNSTLARDEQVAFLERKAEYYQKKIQQIAEIRKIDSERLAHLQNIIDTVMVDGISHYDLPLAQMEDEYIKMKQAILDADEAILQFNTAYEKIIAYKNNIQPGIIEYN